MEYSTRVQARVPSLYLITMAFLFTTARAPSWHIAWVFTSSILYFVFFIIIMFMHYKITISENAITYSILIFKKSLYTKHVTSDSIKRIVFKRANWATKFAHIKTINGFNIRLLAFKPDRIYDDLIDFCTRNQVEYVKTKDFELVDRMARTKAVSEK